jgi:arsenate reductase (thioredoxin)
MRQTSTYQISSNPFPTPFLKERVLFICIHNSARSQMAEALLNHMCPEFFEAESAGLHPGKLNPLAVTVMREIGIDIRRKKPRSAADAFMSGRLFSTVITVGDEAGTEPCADFPGVSERLRWSFPNPSTFQGTRQERLAQTRQVRDLIAAKIQAWCKEVCPFSIIEFPGEARRD